jgi:hypothetical protein
MLMVFGGGGGLELEDFFSDLGWCSNSSSSSS